MKVYLKSLKAAFIVLTSHAFSAAEYGSTGPYCLESGILTDALLTDVRSLPVLKRESNQQGDCSRA